MEKHPILSLSLSFSLSVYEAGFHNILPLQTAPYFR